MVAMVTLGTTEYPSTQGAKIAGPILTNGQHVTSRKKRNMSRHDSSHDSLLVASHLQKRVGIQVYLPTDVIEVGTTIYSVMMQSLACTISVGHRDPFIELSSAAS